MKQQTQCITAVEWLVKELELEGYDHIIQEAKEMEKEQIEEAFVIGQMNNDSHHYTGRKIHQDQTDYFNKTYNK